MRSSVVWGERHSLGFSMGAIVLKSIKLLGLVQALRSSLLIPELECDRCKKSPARTPITEALYQSALAPSSGLWVVLHSLEFSMAAILNETQQRDLAHDPLFGAYSIVLNYSV